MGTVVSDNRNPNSNLASGHNGGKNKNDVARVERPVRKNQRRETGSEILQSRAEGEASQEVADEDLPPLQLSSPKEGNESSGIR